MSNRETEPRDQAGIIAGPVETRRVYEVSVGPWTRRFAVPDSIDLLDIADRLRGFFGMLSFWALPSSFRTTAGPSRAESFSGACSCNGASLSWSCACPRVSRYSSTPARQSSQFWPVLSKGPNLFLASRSSIPRARRLCLRLPGLADRYLRGRPLRRPVSPGRDAVDRSRFRRRDGLAHGDQRRRVAQRGRVAFSGPDRGTADDPPLPRQADHSELLTVMTSGMAHVSGGVMAAYFAFGVEPRHILTAVIMTAPGAILLSKILVPETERPETLGTRESRGNLGRRQRARRSGPRHPRRSAPCAQHRRDPDLVSGIGRPHEQGIGVLRDIAPGNRRVGNGSRSLICWVYRGKTARPSANSWARGPSSMS